jgi:hypothetical protein
MYNNETRDFNVFDATRDVLSSEPTSFVTHANFLLENSSEIKVNNAKVANDGWFQCFQIKILTSLPRFFLAK